MRKFVADGIEKDPAKYNEAILGYPAPQYISKILQPNTWGGAIELAILASHFNTEISSVDVETGRIDHFSPGGGDDGGSGMRCVLIYSGIHYDAATVAPVVDAPAEWHQTIFPIRSSSDASDPILVAAKKLAGLLRERKAFTNTATFDLKCEDCGLGLKGEKGAREHAEQTGHVKFGEY
jgi:ubiquitin thioesterase OTU1